MGFKRVKSMANAKKALKDQTDKKSGSDFSDLPIFNPQLVKGEDKTRFKIRFLDLEDESPTGVPWVEYKFHMFTRDGDQKYVKFLDPTSIDSKLKNPVKEHASKLFNTGNVKDNERGKELWPKARYFTKVYVQEAPESQSDLVGKVLIYECGIQVIGKLKEEIDDAEDDDVPFWDAFEGKTFILQLEPKDKWANYSNSKFSTKPTPIVDDEEELEKIYEAAKALSIKEMVIEKKEGGLKTEEQIKKLFLGGLKDEDGEDIQKSPDKDDDMVSVNDDDFDIDDEDEKPLKKPVEKPSKPSKNVNDDDDEKPSKPSKPSKKEEKKDDDEDDMDFDDEDFNLDE